MKFSLKTTPHYAVFELQESTLNSVMAPELKSKLVVLSNEGIKRLILDLSNLEYVDSSGLSAILTADRLWGGEKGNFILTGVVHSGVKKLISISRLDKVLNIIPTISEAEDYFKMEELERQLMADPGEPMEE
ncbi:MAG TPA: anti-sigma factor antagonist [Desulfobulbaceae bacterium]|nr:anti-sigma factor antagonist [Desulfobulbaceae bacterium]